MALGDFVHGGGPILVIIIILGLIGLFFFFERLFVLLRERNEMMATVIKVRNSIAQKNITAAKQHCRSSSTLFSSVMLRAFEYYDQQKIDLFDNGINDVVEEESLRLERNYRYINIVAILAPLLGFLGTVIGMMQIFGKIGTNVNVQNIPSYTAIFSSGISLALYTTVGGLAVAIPLLILMAILRELEDRILESTNEEVRSVVMKLKSLPLEEVQ
ncbi:MAG: MotA/TolQ/ExbB proton channel family protein [Thermotogae bacterium]|jgi:biopolymer transport protein ExbB|nr:MotA/TolQ/ExbB proton channel family protein [Thermotogota bacterium]MCL5032227.1 MotA/TolQ/ExbB proton channel family protein [Thermotogota bacterium]